MIKDILSCVWWITTFLVQLVLTVLGWFIIPIALCFITIPKNPAEWRLIRLPRWALPWDNLRDGVLSDRRFDYWHNRGQYPEWFDKLPKSHLVKAWYWLAIRNPVNYMKRYCPGFGCDVRKCEITYRGDYFVSDTKRVQGWQFVKAAGKIFNYFGFYYYKETEDRYTMLRFGHKIEPRYADQLFEGDRENKALKGSTLRLRWRRKIK